VATEQIAKPLALEQSLGHPVEPRLEEADLAAVVHLHASLQLAPLHLLEARSHRSDRIGDRLRGEHRCERPHGGRHDPEEEDRRRQVLGVDSGLRHADEPDHDHPDQRHAGAQGPRPEKAVADPGGDHALGWPRRERAGSHRPQDAFGDQVDERAGRLAAEPRRRTRHGGELPGVQEGVQRDEDEPATDPGERGDLDLLHGPPQRHAVLAVVRDASLGDPVERVAEVVEVPVDEQPDDSEVGDEQRHVEKEDLLLLARLEEDRDQEADRRAHHDDADGVRRPAGLGDAPRCLIDELGVRVLVSSCPNHALASG
jgi:hypothetical protein